MADPKYIATKANRSDKRKQRRMAPARRHEEHPGPDQPVEQVSQFAGVNGPTGDEARAACRNEKYAGEIRGPLKAAHKRLGKPGGRAIKPGNDERTCKPAAINRWLDSLSKENASKSDRELVGRMVATIG